MKRAICALAVSSLLAIGTAFFLTAQNGNALKLAGGSPVPVLTGVSFGTPFQYNLNHYPTHYVNADGMSTTWNQAGTNLVVLTDTGGGVDGALTSGANEMIGALSTTNTTAILSSINNMAAWGTVSQCTGSPSASHKMGGIITIGSEAYGWNYRLNCSSISPFDATLLKSPGDASAWTPVPPSGALPYSSVMFPGTQIPIAFVQYGQAYTTDGRDNSNLYVYSTVYNSSPVQHGLARCLISALPNQNAADWSFYTGGDGLQNANWSSSISAAADIGTGLPSGGTQWYYWNIQYLPRYGIYAMVNYTVVGSNTATFWSFDTAPHPWGPWTELYNNSSTPYTSQGLNFPNIMPASVYPNSNSITVIASSNFINQDPHTGTYTLWIVPTTLTP